MGEQTSPIFVFTKCKGNNKNEKRTTYHTFFSVVKHTFQKRLRPLPYQYRVGQEAHTYTIMIFLSYNTLKIIKIQLSLASIQSVQIVFTSTHDNLVKLTQTSTSRYQMATDYILLHSIQSIALAVDSSLIEHFRGLLELGSRHERISSQ